MASSAALRLGPDMAVAFHHLLGDVPRDRHDGLVACLPLGQLRDCGVPQVVEAALEAGLLESIAPRGTPSFGWPCGINLAVLAPRENEVLGISLGLTDHKLTPHEVDLLPAQGLDFRERIVEFSAST